MLKNLDYYRRVPKDLTISTTHGFILSVCSIFILLLLFLAETLSFLYPTVVSSAVVDSNTDHTMRITFNITVLAIACEFATVSNFDVLGSRNFNITQNIRRYSTDAEGNILSRHRAMRDDFNDRSVRYDEHLQPIEHLHLDGEHAVPLDPGDIDGWLASHSHTFVTYFAPWCSHCVKLAPAYETLAERVHEEQLDVSVVKIDCEKHHDYCVSQRIHGFPTLRMFKGATVLPPDYNLDRTVDTMFRFLKTKVFAVDNENVRERQERKAEEHKLNYGCQLTGYMKVNRVPGVFTVEARSAAHDINPIMTNVSLQVNHLSFGPHAEWRKGNTYFVEPTQEDPWFGVVPGEFYSPSTVSPLNGKKFNVDFLHQSFHHYMKVITTQFGFDVDSRAKKGYQFVASSSLKRYNDDDVPKAVFTYDLSPMSILIEHESKRWYDYLCSICAVIGGSFTVVGFLSAMLSCCIQSK